MMVRRLAWLSVCAGLLYAGELEVARDKQDKAALQTAVGTLTAAAQKTPQDAQAQYRFALAKSYQAEVALELRDKAVGRSAAEEGIAAAQKAVDLQPKNAEYHRLLGTLCGQVISNYAFAALKHGRCAMDEINKSIELDGKNALAYVSRGVGNYYLPPQLGGGLDQAIKDFEKAEQLDPKLSEAYLWKGVALRKSGRNAEAQQALQKALQLNPQRAWTKQQLDKTPAR